jgi:hypothetical protein
MSSRTDNEQEYRRFVARKVIPQIIVDCFSDSI